MAAATATALLGTSMAAFQAIKGAKQAKDSKRALSQYERQELDNAFKDVDISTLGSDILKEQSIRASTDFTNAASNAGSRAIIGGIPKITSAVNDTNMQAAKLIDDQVQQREYAIAQDNTRIEGITEARDIANIGALSSQQQAGNQDMWSGIMGIGSSLAYGVKANEQSKDASGNFVNPGAVPETIGFKGGAMGDAVSNNLNTPTADYTGLSSAPSSIFPSLGLRSYGARAMAPQEANSFQKYMDNLSKIRV